MPLDSMSVVTYRKEPRYSNPNTTDLPAWDAGVTLMTVHDLEMMTLHIAQQCK